MDKKKNQSETVNEENSIYDAMDIIVGNLIDLPQV